MPLLTPCVSSELASVCAQLEGKFCIIDFRFDGPESVTWILGGERPK